ncbi:sugar phosphate isomerase/epimerase family protein [Membranihabitans maritimus]|uniref:sugar phosphate isomerase/epimerase family protein n=1 Tax=Membranihabitans maritimus TaxID=2904244 RepID=UPI001F1D859F|nr:sugar phosphate isomerase/epimerase [Membranihabitans maritimus]
MMLPITRRTAIFALGGLGLSAYIPTRNKKNMYPGKLKIGACDWSIGNHSNVEAFYEAKKIGLDGVQVSLGKQENNMHLRKKSIQDEYLGASKSTGVEIASLAIGELNKYPYKSDPQTIQWVADSIDVAANLNCNVVLLAFFGSGDLKGDLSGQKEVIDRLREVMPEAEAKGIILGIESWLSGDEHLSIIDAVGSGNLKIYYDVANSEKMGYDIYREIRQLGNQICEIHMKENGFLLGQGRVDFNKVREAMEEIDYSGWIQIEGAVPPGEGMRESYIANNRFLRETFDI